MLSRKLSKNSRLSCTTSIVNSMSTDAEIQVPLIVTVSQWREVHRWCVKNLNHPWHWATPPQVMTSARLCLTDQQDLTLFSLRWGDLL